MTNEIIKTALTLTTGKTVTNIAVMNAGSTVKEIVNTLSNNTLPVHFNTVKNNGTKEDIKDGFVLITEKDSISYMGGLYQGMNKIYTSREINAILKEEIIMVK